MSRASVQRLSPQLRRNSLIGAVSILALAAGAAHGQAGGTWSTPAGVLQGTRYSTLTDITSSNVGTLTEEFAYPTGVKFGHQGGPLVVNTVMYVVTPFPNRLIALDLTHPGRTLWTFDPGAGGAARGVACCDVVNRGASYANGLVIYNVLDGNTVAVNAVTGKQVWKTRLANPGIGETLTGAPIIVNGHAIVGVAGGEMGVRGWVQALDAATGKPVWKAYNTGPDADVLIDANFHPYYAKDQGHDLGATSWPGTMYLQGGATSWAWLSYDPALNLLYYGTSNPGVWNPDMRPGDNKWAATIFARNPDTGKAVWAYQLTPHDGWDFDAVNEDIVADLPIGGAVRQVLVHFNKNGFAYTLDRKTGQLLVAQPFVANVNWATGISLTTGLPSVVAAKVTHQGVITPNICPSFFGAKDMEPAAFSLATKLFYVPAINYCVNTEPLLTLYIAGSPFWGTSFSLTQGAGGYGGELVAWDAARGARAWSVPEKLPLYGGVLATAGNVVFYGTLDKQFKAVDATTGRVLFQKQLECGIISNPMTYSGPDGKQRVAVMTGVGWLPGSLAGGNCPAGNVFGDTVAHPSTPLGEAMANYAASAPKAPPAAATSGYVHVFRLP